ncbi:MAG: hypothetical protein Q7S78_01255 [Candidatus Azambacteria bacterium]|nr:hypothetical protein [Candidatus Azambacteria bacterium]
MLNIKPYKSIMYVAGIFTLISIYLFFFYPNFTNSNLYTAIATFLVGLFAIYLYITQKEDQKKDAANVIIAEIRQAERLIDQFKKSGISNDISYKLLPSNNWAKYNYLFINDLDQDEIEQINNFYSQCFVLDRAIDQINISHELENKSRAIHHYISLIAKESSGDKITFNTNKDNFLKLINEDTTTFRPGAPISSIIKALNNINLITTSMVGSRLKKIARIK